MSPELLHLAPMLAAATACVEEHEGQLTVEHCKKLAKLARVVDDYPGACCLKASDLLDYIFQQSGV